MSTRQFLTGWHSGDWPGGTYGLRFGALRESLVEPGSSYIKIQLEGESAFQAALTGGFWKDCPEIRDPLIRDWMMKQKVSVPWPKGFPPRFPLECLGPNYFHVYYQTR